MADYKYGTPIFFDVIKKELEFEDITATNDILKEMSKRAMKSINAPDGSNKPAQNAAIDRANGMKDEWGTGISTRVIIYNASGYPITFRSKSDSSGRWSKYGPTSRIEVGEWGVCFHHKKSGTMTGSCAVAGFNIHGYSREVLMVGFDTPYSGSNSAYCNVMGSPQWSKTSWDDLHDLANGDRDSGKYDCGCLRTEFNIDQDSSPLLTVKLYRNDIGL